MIARQASVGFPPCIVLAGGLGTRLRSVVAGQPKCLAPVGARTFLEIQLELLASRGIDHFVLSLGYLADAVIKTVQPLSTRFRIDWVTEPHALGTGGAVLHAMATLGLKEVVVTNGDTWLDAPLHAFAAELDVQGSELMRIAVVDSVDRSRYGGPVLSDDGRVLRFVAKGVTGPGSINAGFYRIHDGVFKDRLPGQTFSIEADVMPGLAAGQFLRAVGVVGKFIDIGVPDDYQRFCASHG
jgi:D-glycero-alpha-D-manno-heptose 1-phosphate guanylyltransferase